MNHHKGRIVFVHDGLAYYPSMLASKEHLSSKGYLVEEMGRQQAMQSDLSDAIVWVMMGFYPRPPTRRCRGVIHEYRSQSIGRFNLLRDLLKKALNHTPSYRLFQSDRIRLAVAKNDDVPYGLLPLGVPSWIIDHRALESPIRYDFCYIGAINEDRRIPLMLDAFVASYGTSRTIALVGDVRDGIDRKYSNYSNIEFLGRLSQRDTFGVVNSSRFSVCFFPSHPPHCYQPPTKLYEYAALGRKIVANRSPANLQEIERLGIEACIMEEGRFPSDQDLGLLQGNSHFDPSPLFFENALEASGVVAYIERTFATT